MKRASRAYSSGDLIALTVLALLTAGSIVILMRCNA